MFVVRMLDWVRGRPVPAYDASESAAPEVVDRRAEERIPVFREAVLTLEGYYRIRAVITDVSTRGVGIKFATRVDLPSRLVISAPTLKLHRWARVAWQRDGVAGLELQEDA